MKNCEKCGTANETDVRFCVNCGNELLNKSTIPKRRERVVVPEKEKSEPKQIFCEQCGKANEDGVTFCVNCGNNISSEGAVSRGNHVHTNKSHQERPGTNSYITDEEMMRLRSVPNPVVLMWNNFLFPEKMIVIGAILNCVLAVFWIFGGILSVLMTILYFATMGASLVLIHLSRQASLLKKTELASWQIAIGAFWLSWLFDILISNLSHSYYGGSNNLALYFFSTVLSVVMLLGAVMLQGMLLKLAFVQKNK